MGQLFAHLSQMLQGSLPSNIETNSLNECKNITLRYSKILTPFISKITNIATLVQKKKKKTQIAPLGYVTINW